MKKLKITFAILSLFIAIGCNNSKRKENAENEVRKFFNALNEGNQEKMKTIYEGFANLSSYYRSDSASIIETKINDNDVIEVRVLNQFTNNFGKKFYRDITIYLQKDLINDLNYKIFDSKGMCGYDEDLRYKFAKKTGCITNNDTTDQQIEKKLYSSYAMLLDYKTDVYDYLKSCVMIVDMNWEKGWGGSASGKGIVTNISSFNFSELLFKITYKDADGYEVTTDHGYVTQSNFNSGDTKAFTFYTSYVANATKASIELMFEDEMIMEYLANKDYTGNECHDFFSKIDSTSNY